VLVHELRASADRSDRAFAPVRVPVAWAVHHGRDLVDAVRDRFTV